MKSEMEIINRCFEEFDPFLSNAVMESLYCNGQKLEKSKFLMDLKRQYENNCDFADECRKNLISPFGSNRLTNPDVIKRIRDVNLLYTIELKFKPELKIENKRKVNGRAFELVLESIMQWKLMQNPRLNYEFVDWRIFDYLISDKKKNDWVAGIQCKVCFSYRTFQNELQEMKNLLDRFSEKKTFIMFCGFAKTAKMEEMKKMFKKVNIGLYFLWTADDSTEIEPSFYELIDEIGKI